MATPLTERAPASWEDYLALGDDVRAEYVDGFVVMAPRPTRRHQQVVYALRTALTAALPSGYAVEAEWAWRVGRDEFAPDVMVFPETEEQTRFTGAPVLCVEVLSTNRAADYITKAAKYAAAGLPRYWIVDPETLTIDVLIREGGTYRVERTVSASEPVELDLGVGSLVLDLSGPIN